MKKFLAVILIVIGLVSCTQEETQQIDSAQKKLPEWVKGIYTGVHTGKPLTVNINQVKFEIEDSLYEFSIDNLTDMVIEENKITIYKEDDILIFNKTTLETEINLQFNELYLGWFRKTTVQ